MSDEKHPYDLNKPSHFDKATNRISGFIGGGVAGLVIGVIGLVLATKLSSVPLDFAFFGIIVSVFLFALIGAIWPKWFAWILDILMFW